MKITVVHSVTKELSNYSEITIETTLDHAAIAALALSRDNFDSFGFQRLVAALQGEELSISAAAEETRRPRFLALDVRANRAIEIADGTFEPVGEEMTGEQLLALVRQIGGTAVIMTDPVTGIVDEIHASFSAAELPEGGELDSLQAGTPHKSTGDLAQTSVLGANGQAQILALMEWSLSWKRKTVEATTTDDGENEDNLGSTRGWTAKAKYAMLLGDSSQQDNILVAITTQSLPPLPWNFFPTIEAGSPAFQGVAIIDGIDVSGGNGKIVGLDVSLKGKGPLKILQQAAPIANANTTTGQSAQV